MGLTKYTAEQVARLIEAMNYCDENDKSTMHMIQLMQDHAGVSHDKVMSFLREDSRNETHQETMSYWTIRIGQHIRPLTTNALSSF